MSQYFLQIVSSKDYYFQNYQRKDNKQCGPTTPSVIIYLKAKASSEARENIPKCFDIDGFVVKVCWYMRGYHSIDVLENTDKTE